MKKIFVIIILCGWIALSGRIYAASSETNVSFNSLFNEICELVKENFYNPSVIQEKFPALENEYREKMKSVSTQDDFSEVVKGMLNQLKASHTYYLSPADYEYYHLAAIFSSLPDIQKHFDNKEIMYPTVGIVTETIKGKIFIASVLPGSAAEKAGLLKGDEIIFADEKPYRPIESIKNRVGKDVSFKIKRTHDGEIKNFFIKPVMINPKTEMLEAERASIRIIEKQGKKIGYIHIYSYAGEEYHEELISAISFGKLKDADALIIDLRYGLGGADPKYLNIFNTNVPILSSADRAGNKYVYDPQWRKPAVLLVNNTSRSGKELIAFGAKKYKLATIIGERTAGAVLGGRLFLLANGDLLYLAARSGVVDGVILEGIGVAPDIEVLFDIRYCNGKDKQLEKSVDYLIESLQADKVK